MIRFRAPLNLALVAAMILTTLAGFLVIPPGTSLPIHWGLGGEADAHLPRDWALLQLLVVLLVVWAIFWAIARWGTHERREASAPMMNVALTAITALMALIQGLVVLIGLGVPVNVVQAVVAALGLMEIALGNVMPKSRPNSVAGVRIPTTLADPANWAATHRLTGLLAMAAGALLVLAAFVVPVGAWLLAAVFAAWLVPMIVGSLYSLAIARRHPA
jgi:uncharacterized membrane protein